MFNIKIDTYILNVLINKTKVIKIFMKQQLNVSK